MGKSKSRPAPSKTVKFRTRIGHHAKLNLHYLEIPARVVAAFGGKFSARLVLTVNTELTFQGGLVALGDGKGYVSFSAARMKKIGVKRGDSVAVLAKTDRSKFGMEYPEELRALLAQDDEGKLRFEKLVPGKQRYVVYYVGQVKSSPLRLERALRILGNLKNFPPEKITFRQMLGMPPVR